MCPGFADDVLVAGNEWDSILLLEDGRSAVASDCTFVSFPY